MNSADTANEVNDFINRYSGLTEEYKFYDGQVTLRYDPKDHVYLLVTPDGQLEPQEGVTSCCHIIDKSLVLIPWACKMMAQKMTAELEFWKVADSSTITLPQTTLEDIITRAKAAHKEKLEEAGAIGHIAHNWIESYIKAVLSKNVQQVEEVLANMPADERARNACIAALDWANKHNIRFLSTERKVYSRKYKYAGTMDGLCVADSCSDINCCKHKFKNHLTILDWKTSNYLYAEFRLQVAAYKRAFEEETGERVKDRWIIRLGKDDGVFEAWHLESETFKDDWAAFKDALTLKRSMAVVDDRTQQMKDERRKAKKAAKAEAKAVAATVRCSKADKYQGKRKPTCNGGKGCEFCVKKYEEMQNEKSQRLLDLVNAKAEKKRTKAEKRSAGITETAVNSLTALLNNS